jgi:hypothetical protein
MVATEKTRSPTMFKNKLSGLLSLILTVAAAGSSAQAGRVGGPGQAVEIVYGGQVVEYTLWFRANEVARVVVDGDGSSDLDLFVYDEYGNLVASDTDYTDYCVATWVPRWTGRFLVRVVNRGVDANVYEIRTN